MLLPPPPFRIKPTLNETLIYVCRRIFIILTTQVNWIKFSVYLGTPGGVSYFELMGGFNFDPYVCANYHKPM